METKFNIGETVYVVADIHNNETYELYEFKIKEIKISENKISYSDYKRIFPEVLVARTIDEAKQNIIRNLRKEFDDTCINIHSLKLKKGRKKQ